MALSLNTAFSFDDNGLSARKRFKLQLVEKSDVQKVSLTNDEETGNDLHLNTNLKEHIRSAEELEQNISEQDSQNCKRKIYHDWLKVERVELDARDTDESIVNLLPDERNGTDSRCIPQATADLGGDDGNFTDSGQRVVPSKPDANETVDYEFEDRGQRYEPSQPVANETDNSNCFKFRNTGQRAGPSKPVAKNTVSYKFKDTGQGVEPSKVSKPDGKKTLNDTGKSTTKSKYVKFEKKVESELVSNKEHSKFATENAEHSIISDSGIPKKSHIFMECNKGNNFHDDAKNEQTCALRENNHSLDRSKGNPKGPYLRKTQKKRHEIWPKKPWSFSSSKTFLTKKHWIPLVARDWIRLFTTYFYFGVLFLYFTGVGGTLTTVPLNTIVIQNQTARLTCTTNPNQRVFWMRIPTGSIDQQYLYYGTNGFNMMHVEDRYSIDKDESIGRYDLVIADVQPKDAGQYQCIDESGLGKSVAAELVVVGSMHCGTDSDLTEGVMAYNVFGIEQDGIQMTCNLTYSGNIAPHLSWSWPGSEKQREPPITTEASNSVTSKLRLSPTKELNNVTFTCQATINGSANRYIDERLTWKSKPIVVGYAEFEQRAVPECPGINWNLICNPACSYTFVKTEDSGCQCQYTYMYYYGLKDKIYRETSGNITCVNGLNLVVPIVIAIAISAVCVCVALGVLIFIKGKRKRERPNSEEELLRSPATEGIHKKQDSHEVV